LLIAASKQLPVERQAAGSTPAKTANHSPAYANWESGEL
jgi:hypothetical protein